ncbi:hypothetical protein EN981_14425, partial [Mesorhizobium sp. M7A.F.Ca.CA.001.13.2.1]
MARQPGQAASLRRTDHRVLGQGIGLNTEDIRLVAVTRANRALVTATRRMSSVFKPMPWPRT